MEDLIIDGIDYGHKLDMALLRIKLQIELQSVIIQSDPFRTLTTQPRSGKQYGLNMHALMEMSDELEKHRPKNHMSGKALSFAEMNYNIYGVIDPDLPSIPSKQLSEMFEMARPKLNVDMPKLGRPIFFGNEHTLPEQNPLDMFYPQKPSPWLEEDRKKQKELYQHQMEHYMFRNEYEKPAKLTRKIPMRKEVIDEENAIWEYYIDNGKVNYIFIGHVTSEI